MTRKYLSTVRMSDIRDAYFAGKAGIKIRLPGLLAATVVAVASQFLAHHYSAPVMLFALLLGMAMYFLYEEGVCRSGIQFTSSWVLKFGVALLGFGISYEELTLIGWPVVCLVLGAVLMTILAGPLFSRLFGYDHRLGVLTAGAVAICGASAALAISSVLPKSKMAERDTAFTVVLVTTLSTVAMIAYPILAFLFNFDGFYAGVFFGATIHDVAQVVGAGYSVSEEAGDTSTIVKLLRVSMLIPVVVLVPLLFFPVSDDGSRKLPSIPLFVIGFVISVVLGNTVFHNTHINDVLLDTARWCLVISIAAIGMKTSLKALRGIGAKAIGLVIVETVFLAVLVLCVLFSGLV
ncbi:MAG: putative sulfate exporter family transporter [Alphaproteobacteria bacterium]